MERLTSLTYEVDGRVGRITLDRPERGNAITLDCPPSWLGASSGPTSTRGST